jgi:hypothetical protein
MNLSAAGAFVALIVCVDRGDAEERTEIWFSSAFPAPPR